MDSTTREDASSKEGGCNGILHIPKYYVLDHRDRTFLVWWLVHHMFTQRVKVKLVTKSNQSDGGGPRTHHTLIVWNDSTIPTRSIDCTSTRPALCDPRPPGISSTCKVPQHSTKTSQQNSKTVLYTRFRILRRQRSADRVPD